MPVALKRGVRKDHTHQGDRHSQNQKSPACVIRPHLHQTEQRDREPIQEHRRGMSSAPDTPGHPPAEPLARLVLGDVTGGMHQGWTG